MDFTSGVPDPLEGGEPRPEGDGSNEEWPSTEWVPEEDGPQFPWLPPEDRLWRHPSEAAPMSRGDGGPAGPGGSHRSWADALPRSLFRTTWAVAVIAGLVGATAATGIGVASGLWSHQTTVVRSVMSSSPSVSLADIGAEPTNWTAVDDSVSASVVSVSVQGSAGPQVGSGLVLLQAGGGRSYVVTDRSLFARGEAMGYVGTVDVTFLSGATYRAKLVGEDALSGLAVLSISDASQGVPAALGTVADLRQAQQVLVVGSHTAPSVATGTISAEDRTVSLADGTDLDNLLALAMPTLGATAAGGPLLNEFGQVVGVTLSLDPVDQADQALTFAVPIDEVSRVATDLIDGDQPSHPWLGVTDADDVPSTMAHQLGVEGGVQAGQVAAESPAGVAGVRNDDIITSLDDKPIVSTGGLLAQVETCVPGGVVPITYLHAGRTVTTTVRVGDEPRDS